MKSIQIYVRGICDTTKPEKEGKYLSILCYNGKEKEIYGAEKKTTSNRMVITGVIKAIKILKEPCNVTVYTHTTIGIAKYKKKSKGINKDLLSNLFETIKERNHEVEFIYTQERQSYLASKL